MTSSENQSQLSYTHLLNGSDLSFRNKFANVEHSAVTTCHIFGNAFSSFQTITHNDARREIALFGTLTNFSFMCVSLCLKKGRGNTFGLTTLINFVVGEVNIKSRCVTVKLVQVKEAIYSGPCCTLETNPVLIAQDCQFLKKLNRCSRYAS